MLALVLFFSIQVFQPRFVEQKVLKQNADTLISTAWTVDQGLPVNTVNTIAQDSKGYIWFTTYDGIVRFDGIEFTTYNHSNTPAMPQNRAVFMHLQKGAGIWVTLENGGIILIDENGHFTHFDESNGFTSANTTHMMQDSRGHMWFSTFNGLFKYDGDTFQRIINRDTPDQNRISTTYEDTDGSIWAATHDGLVVIRGNQQRVFNLSPGSISNQFRQVQRYNSDELLVSGLEGLYLMGDNGLYVPEKFKLLESEPVPFLYKDEKITLISTDIGLYKYDDSLSLLYEHQRSNSYYWTFYRDTNNVLWMISTHGEIIQLKNDQLVKLQETGIMPDFYFNNLLEDREQNMWFATARNGIHRMKASKIRTIGKQEGLSGDNILGLFEDSKGRFWVGTRDFGLNVIDGNEITQYREADIQNRDIVHSINEDYEGNVWVGYYQGGVDRFNEDGVKSYDIGFAAGLNDIRSIFVSRDSTIWIGTYGGLVKFDPVNEHHTIYTTKDGLANNLVRYIDEDLKGGLWIGTMAGGVSYFKDETFTNYSIQDGLTSNNIRSIYVDKDDANTVWIGTEDNGLNRIKNGEITSLTITDGLPNHVIHYIGEDDLGWLWMSSNSGIIKIDKHELNQFLDKKNNYYNLIHFGKEEGMVNPEANGSFQQGGLKTSHDTFWFATQEGVAIFDISPKQTNSIPPTVLIDGLTANGKFFPTDSIHIEPGTGSFRINFKALTFVSPEKTRYRYKLEGFNDNWHEVINQRQVNYSNVPAGEYTFRVLAANNDGVWNEAGASISFNIDSVFYKKLWFYLLVIFVVGFGYYAVSQLRYRYLVRKQEQLQMVIEEQTAQLRKEKNEIEEKSSIIRQQADELEESNKTKDKFFSLIAHDLRNPFQAILGYSEMMLDDVDEADRKELKTGLEHIHVSSKYLLNLVEHLLNWASLHTGKIQPDPEEVNLRELIERIHQLFEHIAGQKNIELNITATEDFYLNADLNMLQTILRNLISNAIKFTPEHGTVSTRLFQKRELYIIEVEDNGIGMPQKLIDKLLHLDANTSRTGTNNEKGSGLGLLICREMMNLHNGKIQVKSTEGTGTKFTLTFPKEGITQSAKTEEKSPQE